MTVSTTFRGSQLKQEARSTVGGRARCLPSQTYGVDRLLDGVAAANFAHIAHVAQYFEPGRHRVPGITQVAGSDSHMCMLLNTGRVMCWGSNTAGESGNLGLFDWRAGDA